MSINYSALLFNTNLQTWSLPKFLLQSAEDEQSSTQDDFGYAEIEGEDDQEALAPVDGDESVDAEDSEEVDEEYSDEEEEEGDEPTT